MFTGIISVLHEAGALVCVEGIETEAEALCAIDANADSSRETSSRRERGPVPENARSEVFERLITAIAPTSRFQKRQHMRLVPYLAAIKNAVQTWRSAPSWSRPRRAAQAPSAQRCY